MNPLQNPSRVIFTAVALTLISFCSLAQAQLGVSLVIGSGGNLEVEKGTSGTIPVFLDSFGHASFANVVIASGTFAVDADLLDQNEISFDITGSIFSAGNANPSAVQDLNVAFPGSATVNGTDGLEFLGTLEFDTSNLEVGDTFVLSFADSEFLSFVSANLLSTTSNVQVTVVDGSPLLGDANLDGVVNFLDIGPFIAILSGGGFLDEADINRDSVVSFLDIGPFISILSGQ